MHAMVHALFALLFPAQCAGCNGFDSGLCERCAPSGEPPLVRMLPSLRILALGEYAGAYRRAVLALKDGRRDVAASLGERLGAHVAAGTVLVPVPTTAARRRVRGIDGVEMIASDAAVRAGAKVVRALRAMGNDAQQGLDRAHRLSAHGRFTCDSTLVAGQSVVLVDDVCTTGSTLEDCARAIRATEAHVSEAFVVAVANGWA
jgi:predicted amidophosphoribosyltransferase